MKARAWILLLALSGALAPQARAHLRGCDEVFADVPNQLPESVRRKYNTPEVLTYEFTPADLDKLQAYYHQLPVPEVVEKILHGEDPHAAHLAAHAPDLFVWNEPGNTFLTPNPIYTKPQDLVQARADGTQNQLKEKGLVFVAWYAHPSLRAAARAPGAAGTSRGQTIADVAAAQPERYLASIMDLQPGDLAYLRDLKKQSLDYLKTHFGVDPSRDKVELKFHFPYVAQHATLHLHVRVNVPNIPLEEAKCISLDEIIQYLEAGKTVKQLILDRQRRQPFYFSQSSKKILEVMDKDKVKAVPNPFYEPF